MLAGTLRTRRRGKRRCIRKGGEGGKEKKNPRNRRKRTMRMRI